MPRELSDLSRDKKAEEFCSEENMQRDAKRVCSPYRYVVNKRYRSYYIFHMKYRKLGCYPHLVCYLHKFAYICERLQSGFMSGMDTNGIYCQKQAFKII